MLFVMSCVTTFRDLQTSPTEILEGPCATFYLPSLCLHPPKLVNKTSLCPLPYKRTTNQVSNIGVCRSIYHTRLSLVNGPIINQNQPIVLLHCRFNILSVQAQMIPHDHCLKIFSLFYQRSCFKHKRSFPFSVNSLPSVSNVGIRLVGFKQNCALFFHSVLVAESC